MRRLIVLRHAKTERDSPTGRDFDRRLDERGQQDAHEIGKYLADKGEFATASGNRRCYFASDNVTSEQYKGLTPEDLINIAMFHSLMFDGTRQEGVMFHLVGALSEYGKLGVVCIGATPEAAKAYYDRTLEVLDWETGK